MTLLFGLMNQQAISSHVFTPSDQLATLKDWMEMADVSTLWQEASVSPTTHVTVFNGSQPIGHIDSKVSGGPAQSATSNGFRPLANVANSKNVAIFDGVDDRLLSPSVDMSDASGQLSVAIAINPANITGTQYLLSQQNASNIWAVKLVAGVPTATFANTVGTVFTATAPVLTAGVSVVVSAVFTTTSVQVFVNGVGGTPTTFTGTTKKVAEVVAFGVNRSTLGSFFAGNYQGHVIDAEVWDTTTHTNFVTYLQGKQ